MKPIRNLLFLFAVLFCIGITNAQKQYVIDGKAYTLTTEVDGTISLLYTSIENEIRFFSKKGTDIKELTNTKNNGDYNEAYKKVLKSQTGFDDTELAERCRERLATPPVTSQIKLSTVTSQSAPTPQRC